MLLGYKARHTISRDLRMLTQRTTRNEVAVDDVSRQRRSYFARRRLHLTGSFTAFWLAAAPEAIFRQRAQVAR
jgi:hypothetical protein